MGQNGDFLMLVENISTYPASAVEWRVEKPGSSQVFSTNNLGAIEEVLQGADRDTLVLWDVDQTLLTPDDPILKPKWDKQLEQWMGGKKVMIDPVTGKTRYIFREILMSAPHSLVDSRSVSLVKEFQERGVPMIAFTLAPGGKVGQVESFVEWRCEELRRFGFDFSGAFSNRGRVELPKDLEKEYPPVYQSGILVTSLHDKGPVLRNFFEAIQWTPKKIIIIDDQIGNVNSIVDLFKDEIETIGIHYTAASHAHCEIDPVAAEKKVHHFIQTSQW